MIRCIVELFGLSREITELSEVEVELNDGAMKMWRGLPGLWRKYGLMELKF